MSFTDQLKGFSQRVESVLDHWLPAPEEVPQRMHQAMRYAMLGGGKRIRPGLAYACAEMLGLDAEQVDAPAAAVELIHGYSLIHDDLPAMDDDDLRRGKPTTHVAFDEPTAIIAGDALQALAFEIIAKHPAMRAAPGSIAACIETLALCCGSRGMAGGQAIDMEAEGQTIPGELLEKMFLLKTGALIRASVVMAAQCSPGVTDETLKRLAKFGDNIGLAFQIKDDILDVEADTATLGKPQGADQRHGKATYPALFGMDHAKQRVTDLYDEALTCLDSFAQRADPLRWMAEFIVHRSY